MKIACPSCEAKYSIGDEKVQNRLAKIRCRKCGADIVIDGRVEPPSITLSGGEAVPGATAAGLASQPEFTVDFAENDQRTLNLSEIVAAYNAGQVTAETFVWSEGMADWTALGQVPAIVDALNSASQPEQAAPVVNATPQPAAAAAAAAARATTKGATGRDLFSKAASAGSEEDVISSQGGYDAQPAQTSTGARNESSVLFSLAALTASTKSRPSVPAPSASVSSALDADSGLIDLKALASQASAAEAAAAPSPLGAPIGAPMGGAPLGGAPLGGAPPIGMAPLGGLGAPLGGSPFGGVSPLSAADLGMPPKKNKTGLFIGGGIALAGIIVAIALALRPEPPPPPAPADPLPLPKPTHTAEPAPQPSSEAKPPPTGTAEEAPPAAATPKKASSGYKGGGKTSGGGGTKKSGGGGDNPTPTPPSTPKSGGGSGCAPGDLICEMKKAAGKK